MTLQKKKSISYAKYGYLFSLPFVIAYLVFHLYPTVYTAILGFTDCKGLGNTNWHFLKDDIWKNFRTILNNATFKTSLKNTVVLWIMNFFPQITLALLLTAWFTSKRNTIKGQGFFKTVFYMPNVIMASAFGLLFMQLFSNVGPINSILVHSGMLDQPYNFLGKTVSMRTLIGVINYLMWFGNTTLMLMAGIQSIDDSIFESARIDGSGAFHTFRTITMPLLKPIFLYVLITSMIGGIQMYDVPHIMTGGNGRPDETSFTLVMYLGRVIGANNYGRAGAISVILFIFTAILSFFIFRSITKDNTD